MRPAAIRQRAATAALAAGAVAAGAVLLTGSAPAPADAGDPARPAAGSPGGVGPPAGGPAHPAARPVPARPIPERPVPPAPPAGLNQRLAAALAPIARRRQGSFAVGVYDPADGRTASYHRRLAFDTASIVKADILAVLLLHCQRDGDGLGDDQRDVATQMIEESDNDSASDLWAAIGGGPGLLAGNAALGVHGVVPGPGGLWGLTTTTVSSELSLLNVLTSARSPLHPAARDYELDLMRHVDPGQDWGVSAAAAAGQRAAVKNGWLPTPPTGLWVINSIGVVRRAGQRLLIAVLSSGQPSEAAGIGQVEDAARAAAAAVTTGRSR
jgi:hypothetical protein